MIVRQGAASVALLGWDMFSIRGDGLIILPSLIVGGGI